MDVEAIRAALRCDRAGCPCQRSRGNVHCPAHEDTTPSLSVTERDGRTLVHCFAGCAQEDVLEALRQRGLWGWKPPAPALSRLRRGRLEGPLDEVARFVERYVVLPNGHCVTAIALWVAHTWVLDAFDVTPYLVVQSAEKRSGKTRLLEVLELLTPQPWRVVQPSEAVLFRKIAKDRPVLLLDEADAVFNAKNSGTEPLRAALNAGFRRGATVPRCVGEGANLKVEDFPVFCVKCLAGIGRLPDTIEDRGIVIRLDRATPAEQRRVRRLRFKEAEVEAAPIRAQLARWAEAALPKLREARPALPEELDGRAADAWEPLLAVAEQAGDGWAVTAWGSALALSTGAAREDESLRVRLLSDIRRVFEEHGTDRLATADLIEALAEDEASPWGDWHGRRMTPQTLSRLLRPFGIRPAVIRTGQVTPRGYRREDFEDAWARYLAPLPPLGASDPQHPQHSSVDAPFSHFPDPQQPPFVAGAENGENPHGDCIVADVADKPPVGREAARGGPPAKGGNRAGSKLLFPDGPCHACHGVRFWVGVYGALVCARCHPPAGPRLVAQWWVRRGSGKWLAVRPAHQTSGWLCTPPEVVRGAVRALLARQVHADA